MSAGDLARVLAVEKCCYAFPWSAGMFLEDLANPDAAIDLLWRGEELAGYLCSWLVAGELHILNLTTAPAFRRHGLAAALLGHVLEREGRRGMAQAFLEVRVGNAPAIGLYRAIGFETVGRRRSYYPDGEDALVMTWRRASPRPEQG